MQAFLWGRNEPPLRGPRFDSQTPRSIQPELHAGEVRVSAGGARASCGVRVDYRVAETPIFMQLSQLEEMAATGAGLTHTLMASGACLAATIPEGYVAAGGNGPLQFCYFRFCAGPEPRRRAGSQVGGNPAFSVRIWIPGSTLLRLPWRVLIGCRPARRSA